jgi:hypothetical protein
MAPVHPDIWLLFWPKSASKPVSAAAKRLERHRLEGVPSSWQGCTLPAGKVSFQLARMYLASWKKPFQSADGKVLAGWK